MLVRMVGAKHVKWKTLLLIAAALAAFGVVYLIQPIESIAYDSFEPRFSNAVYAAGFQMLESRSCSVEEVPLPLRIRLRQSLADIQAQSPASRVHLTIGFPNSAEHYKLRTDNSAQFDCYVRFLDSRVTVIAIRVRRQEETGARTLLSTLLREFPGLAITLTINDT